VTATVDGIVTRRAPAGRALPAPVLGAVGIGIGIALWAAAVGLRLVEGIPGPAEVFRALAGQLGTAALWSATAHTVLVTLAALSCAIVVGVLVGAAVGMSMAVGSLLSSTIDTLRFVPPVALIPVVLLVLGFGVASEIAVAAFAAVWPILLGVASAAAGLRRRYDDVVRVARLGPAQQLRMIYLPGTVPALVTGIRVGSALALILVIAVEMLAVPVGLGHEVRFAGDALALPTMYAYIVWTGIVGIAFNTLSQLVERLATGRPRSGAS
jgi:NitT/TauT family transport system permease protein